MITMLILLIILIKRRSWQGQQQQKFINVGRWFFHFYSVLVLVKMLSYQLQSASGFCYRRSCSFFEPDPFQYISFIHHIWTSKKNLKDSKESQNPILNTSDNSSDIQAFKIARGVHSLHTTPLHPAPCTSTGAWITRITFQSAFPGLRLSCLSYIRLGSNSV